MKKINQCSLLLLLSVGQSRIVASSTTKLTKAANTTSTPAPSSPTVSSAANEPMLTTLGEKRWDELSQEYKKSLEEEDKLNRTQAEALTDLYMKEYYTQEGNPQVQAGAPQAAAADNPEPTSSEHHSRREKMRKKYVYNQNNFLPAACDNNYNKIANFEGEYLFIPVDIQDVYTRSGSASFTKNNGAEWNDWVITKESGKAPHFTVQEALQSRELLKQIGFDKSQWRLNFTLRYMQRLGVAKSTQPYNPKNFIVATQSYIDAPFTKNVRGSDYYFNGNENFDQHRFAGFSYVTKNNGTTWNDWVIVQATGQAPTFSVADAIQNNALLRQIGFDHTKWILSEDGLNMESLIVK